MLVSFQIGNEKRGSVSSFSEWPTTHSEPKGGALWSTVCYRRLRQNRPFPLTLFERIASLIALR